MERTFGIELEIKGLNRTQAVDVLRAAGLNAIDARYTHAVTPEWKVVHDASVAGGCEVVSPVLKGAAGLSEVTKAVKALAAAGARVDKRCGFHVHVGALDLSFAQIKKIFKLYLKNERGLDLLVAPSRRNNGFCRGLLYLGTTEAEAYAKIDACENLDSLRLLIDSHDGVRRYRKLNIEAYWRQKTLEFRQHQGTLSAAKVTNWIQLCVEFVEVGKDCRVRATQGDKQSELPSRKLGVLFNRYIRKPELARYYRRRAEQIARQSHQ